MPRAASSLNATDESISSPIIQRLNSTAMTWVIRSKKILPYSNGKCRYSSGADPRGSRRLTQMLLVLASVRRGRVERDESEAFHSPPHGRHIGKSGPDSVLHQEVIQRKHRSTRINTNDVASNPGPIDVDVAETISAVRAPLLIVLGGTQIFQHGRRGMSDGRERGHEV